MVLVIRAIHVLEVILKALLANLAVIVVGRRRYLKDFGGERLDLEVGLKLFLVAFFEVLASVFSVDAVDVDLPDGGA